MRYNHYKLRRWSVMVRWHARRTGCAICGNKRSSQLQAHHLESKAHNPVEMAYDLSNGIALCGYKGNRCHNIFHSLFMGGTRRKCTPADFDRFESICTWVKEL